MPRGPALLQALRGARKRRCGGERAFAERTQVSDAMLEASGKSPHRLEAPSVRPCVLHAPEPSLCRCVLLWQEEPIAASVGWKRSVACANERRDRAVHHL